MDELFRRIQHAAAPVITEGSPYLIIGLGNPGREYRETRHNVGFMAVDRLCADLGMTIGRMQSKALVGIGAYSGHRMILAKPQTYMNLSGQAVSGLIRFHKVPIENLLILHDDLDLPLGTIRIRANGSSAGQKGVNSIITQLATQEFPRVRIGIGRPPGQMKGADYVLETFMGDEKITMDRLLDQVVKAVKIYITDGLDQAMNLYNGPVERD